MEIIDEIEKTGRSIYTAIGCSIRRDADIAI
jgi:hypothetical protein